MNSPLEILQETQKKLFSLSPSQALEVKAKANQLIKKLSPTEFCQLAHQISQVRIAKENFLPWLDINCLCAECDEN